MKRGKRSQVIKPGLSHFTGVRAQVPSVCFRVHGTRSPKDAGEALTRIPNVAWAGHVEVCRPRRTELTGSFGPCVLGMAAFLLSGLGMNELQRQRGRDRDSAVGPDLWRMVGEWKGRTQGVRGKALNFHCDSPSWFRSFKDCPSNIHSILKPDQKSKTGALFSGS